MIQIALHELYITWNQKGSSCTNVDIQWLMYFFFSSVFVFALKVLQIVTRKNSIMFLLTIARRKGQGRVSVCVCNHWLLECIEITRRRRHTCSATGAQQLHSSRKAWFCNNVTIYLSSFSFNCLIFTTIFCQKSFRTDVPNQIQFQLQATSFPLQNNPPWGYSPFVSVAASQSALSRMA